MGIRSRPTAWAIRVSAQHMVIGQHMGISHCFNGLGIITDSDRVTAKFSLGINGSDTHNIPPRIKWLIEDFGRNSALCYHVLQSPTPFSTIISRSSGKATAMQIPASAHFTPIDLANHYNVERSALDQPLRTPPDVAALFGDASFLGIPFRLGG